jgi:excisionase family DNA binding protein
MTTDRYTTIAGETIEYARPAGELASFLSRVSLAAHDPTVTEAGLTELIYGKENPLLDQSIFPGRGAVTKATLANPVYHVMLDLLDAKRVQAGTLSKSATEAAFTMTVSEAAETLGISPGAVRQALEAKRLAGVKRGPSYFLDPRSVATYRDRVVRRGPEAKHEPPSVPIEPGSGAGKTSDVLAGMIADAAGAIASTAALVARVGNVEGKSFRIKAPGFIETERHGKHVIEGKVDELASTAAVTFSGESGMRMFFLEPAETENEFTFGPFFVRGRYRVSKKINNPAQAAAEWKRFEPAGPTPGDLFLRDALVAAGRPEDGARLLEAKKNRVPTSAPTPAGGVKRPSDSKRDR